MTGTEGMANVDSHDARVPQVNVGTVRERQWHGLTVRTVIWKQRVEGQKGQISLMETDFALPLPVDDLDDGTGDREQ